MFRVIDRIKDHIPIFKYGVRRRVVILIVVPIREAIRLSLLFPSASKLLARGDWIYWRIQIGASTFM